MTTSRREFVQLAAAGTVAGLGLPHGWGYRPANVPKPLRLLILGGTGFLGPHVVRAAMAGGHTVTIFNRGRTNTHLFPDIENLIGDRAGDLKSLQGREWDAVIDNSATNPRWVRDSAQLLKDGVGTYLFTSTRSVYADFSTIGMDVPFFLYGGTALGYIAYN